MQTAHKRKQYSLWNMSNVKTQNAKYRSSVTTSQNGIHGSTANTFSYLLNTDFNGSFASPTVKIHELFTHLLYTYVDLFYKRNSFVIKKLHVYDLKAFVFRRANYSIINEASSSPPKLQWKVTVGAFLQNSHFVP